MMSLSSLQSENEKLKKMNDQLEIQTQSKISIYYRLKLTKFLICKNVLIVMPWDRFDCKISFYSALDPRWEKANTCHSWGRRRCHSHIQHDDYQHWRLHEYFNWYFHRPNCWFILFRLDWPEWRIHQENERCLSLSQRQSMEFWLGWRGCWESQKSPHCPIAQRR